MIKDDKLKLERPDSDAIAGQGSGMVSIKPSISMSSDRRTSSGGSLVKSAEAIKFGGAGA